MDTIQLNLAALITVAVSFVLPVAVALVTRVQTKSAWKSLLLLLLTAVTNFLGQYIASPDHFQWKTVGLTALAGYAAAVAGYYGLWKPVTVTTRLQVLKFKAPRPKGEHEGLPKAA
jgi:hypothetical protein